MLTKICYAWSVIAGLLKLGGVSFMVAISWKLVLLPGIIALALNMLVLVIALFVLWKLR